MPHPAISVKSDYRSIWLLIGCYALGYKVPGLNTPGTLTWRIRQPWLREKERERRANMIYS